MVNTGALIDAHCRFRDGLAADTVEPVAAGGEIVLYLRFVTVLPVTHAGPLRANIVQTDRVSLVDGRPPAVLRASIRSRVISVWP